MQNIRDMRKHVAAVDEAMAAVPPSVFVVMLTHMNALNFSNFLTLYAEAAAFDDHELHVVAKTFEAVVTAALMRHAVAPRHAGRPKP
jgi:hypothetical protein